jgi:hypothetical protein
MKKYEPTGKTYILTNFSDIADIITEENFPYLMNDIALSLSMLCALKKDKVYTKAVELKAIKWIDDGENKFRGVEFYSDIKMDK